MVNIKFKSKSSLKKRFHKKTAKGKIKIPKHPYTSHLAYSKNNTQKKRLHSSFVLSEALKKVIKNLI